MINAVTLVGRLAADPELKYTPTGTALCNLRVAVQDPFRKNDEGKSVAYFFDVVVWSKAAEFAAKYLSKGDTAGLTGRLQVESWTKDGEKRSKVVINCNEISGIGNKPAGAAPAAPAPVAPPPAPKPAPAPAPVAEADYDPFADEDV